MSDKAAAEVDLETATAIMVSGGSKKGERDPDLGKMLPKLSKRISGQNVASSPGSSIEMSATSAVDSAQSSSREHQKRSGSGDETMESDIEVTLQEGKDGEEPAPRPRRGSARQSRGSVTSAIDAQGNVTLLVRPSPGLAPELEKLRTQDINPDENSAAFLALTQANKSGSGATSPTGSTHGETEADGNTPIKRRISMSRQLSGRPQRTTNRKVEGREIQQDHSQYALTYGLMLGIRVMTGRRDLEMDKRQSLSRKHKSAGQSSTGDADRSNTPTSPASPDTGDTSSPRTMPAFSTHSGASGAGGATQSTEANSFAAGLSHRQQQFDSEAAQQMLLERELTIKDFDDCLELKFKPQGNQDPPVPTPPHKLSFSFKFKDYMPAVFRAVRGLSNIDEADYMMSLAGDFNYIEFIANSKSGQFFFYSHDGCYMIKTQTKEECVLLRNIMPKYVEHLSRNPNSLLVRFYGMHRVKFKTSKIYFVIMSSVFNTDKKIDIKYDLKGSLAGRRTSEKACKQGAVQKDLNLMESGRKIRLGEENIELFYETLKADVNLLASLNIMDYSLLVGIHEKPGEGSIAPSTGSGMQRRSSGVVLAQQQRASVMSKIQQSTEQSPDMDTAADVGTIFQSYYGGIPSARGVDEIYFMGIIDILQLYNLNKQTETFYKGLFADRMIQSSIRPDLYASRMLEFIMKHTDYADIMAQRVAAAAAAKNKDAGATTTTAAGTSAGAAGTNGAAADRKKML